MQKESKRERYDVVVIGSGIAGLSAAALLAKAGKSVLVVERHTVPGGCAHGFARRRYRFDSGVHLVSGCGEQGYENGRVIHRILQALGLAEASPFLPVRPCARVVFPELAVELHPGEDAYIEGMTRLFPACREKLLGLMRVCRSIAEELVRVDEVLASGASPMSELPHLCRYRRATLASVLDEFLPDPHLRAAYAGLWPYLGLPPSRLSFLAWATMFAGYVYEGGYYCRGSFQKYADLLAEALRREGGELLLGASVRRILADGGTAAGIVLENGQLIRAEAVVSNIDMRQTAELLIGQEHLPDDYRSGLEKLRPSVSVFVTYLATDLDLRTLPHAHESFFFETFDHDAAYAETLAGKPNWFSATVPTLADPSLAPPCQHLMLLTALSPFDAQPSWRAAKADFQLRLLEKAERHFPGLNGRLLFVESGSPRTVERYTLNHRGAAYGWANSPDQIAARRPGVHGPLQGLFYTGHWTRPGGGIAGVSYSGVLAAQAVLGVPQREAFWSLFANATP
ncbi:NAD(P)/FAD-dependent oxidoreductase [Methylococcus sp. EFPC2]|nr:NAD(P)/FAD-dependent oxidoreductase [Methylococcus sp. EFPC2]